MTTPPEFPAGQPAATPANLASWGTRVLGYLIDIAPGLIVGLVFGLGRSIFLNGVAGLFGVAYTAYMGYLDGLTGQTPGKAIMGTRVVNVEGQVIGTGAGIGRKFVHILDSLICLLGWLLPLVDAKRQTIADKVMNTYVVEGLERKPFSVDLWLPPKTQS
ncbi:MAG: RDD family protein [Acidimicrobiia bacterium]